MKDTTSGDNPTIVPETIITNSRTLSQSNYWKIVDCFYSYFVSDCLEESEKNYLLSEYGYLSAKEICDKHFFGLEIFALEIFILFFQNWEISFKKEKEVKPEYRWILVQHQEKYYLDDETFERVKKKYAYQSYKCLALTMCIVKHFLSQENGQQKDKVDFSKAGEIRHQKQDIKDTLKQKKKNLSEENLDILNNALNKLNKDELAMNKAAFEKTKQTMLGGYLSEGKQEEQIKNEVEENDKTLKDISEILEIDLTEGSSSELSPGNPGGGFNLLNSPTNPETANVEEKRVLLNSLAKNGMLHKMTRLYGRIKRIFDSTKRKENTSMFSLESSGLLNFSDFEDSKDIKRMLPISLYSFSKKRANFRKLAMQKYANEGLKSYPEFYKAKKQKGDIVFYVDNSGSMEGFPEILSKVLVAYVVKNMEKNTKISINFFHTFVHFSLNLERQEQYQSIFNVPFNGGGTNFDAPISSFLLFAEKEKQDLKSYDIVFVTDGISIASKKLVDDFLNLKKSLKINCFCIIVQKKYDPDVLNLEQRHGEAFSGLIDFVDRDKILFLSEDRLGELENLKFWNPEK